MSYSISKSGPCLEVVNGEKHLANNEAALQQQSAALRQYAANLKTGSAERKNALQAQVKAEQKLTFAQYDQIEAQSKMLMLGKQQNNESFKGIRQLIDYGAKVKNNTKNLFQSLLMFPFITRRAIPFCSKTIISLELPGTGST